MDRTRFVRKKDLLVIGALLLLSLAAWGILRQGSGEPARAEILLDGTVAAAVPLNRNQVFSIPQRPQVRLEVRDGRCAFIHSDCPDQICVNTGFIGTPGLTAACLPNRMVLRIAGDGGDAPDIVAH